MSMLYGVILHKWKENLSPNIRHFGNNIKLNDFFFVQRLSCFVKLVSSTS